MNLQKHIEDNNSEVNGGVNGGVNSGIRELNKRDANIYRIIRKNPGLRTTKILEIAKPLDPSLNINIIQKRIKLMSDLIEFVGSSKTGGYYTRR